MFVVLNASLPPEPTRTLLSSRFVGDPFRWARLLGNSTGFADILVYVMFFSLVVISVVVLIYDQKLYFIGIISEVMIFILV